jgi:hypothetical protein
MALYISKSNPCKFIVASLNVSLISVNPIGTAENGTITVVVTGGTKPYLYSINRGVQQQSNQFTGLGEGNYLIQVLDNFGSIGYASVKLYENVVCGTYSGSTLNDIIATNKTLGAFYNCTLNDFI